MPFKPPHNAAEEQVPQYGTLLYGRQSCDLFLFCSIVKMVRECRQLRRYGKAWEGRNARECVGI